MNFVDFLMNKSYRSVNVSVKIKGPKEVRLVPEREKMCILIFCPQMTYQ